VNGERRTALLAGASGLVGGELLRLLAAHPGYARVTVLARRDLGEAVRAGRVRQVLLEDFAQLESLGATLAADHVYCALGTTIGRAGTQARFREVDYEYPRRLAAATLARGAKHYALVSALGASPRSPFFYSRVKGELEQSLRAMRWPSLSIVRPSVIGGDRAESRPMERVAGHVLRFAPRTWRPVAASDIAAAMVHAAWDEAAGTTVIESRDIPGVARRGARPRRTA
jgi:uncharacterized protein YbjT (DUF2867 family)